MSPVAFNIETCHEDWADEGRLIQVDRSDKRGFTLRRMRVIVNGWTLSIIWGSGAYCTGARCLDPLGPGYIESPNAEVAVWRDAGGMIKLGDDTVVGWVSPAAVEDAIAAAERDDEAAICAALAREAA